MADCFIGSNIQKSSSPQRAILAIGQSFIPGREPMANLNASYSGAIPSVYVYNGTGFEVLNSTLNNNQFVGVNGPPNWAPSNEYGYTFYLGKDLSTYYGQQIWYGQYGLGATYLGQTTTPTWNSAVSGSFCDSLVQHLKNMCSYMKSRGQNPSFDVVWDQGYADATNTTLANAYQTNLEAFIIRVNGIFASLGISRPFWYIVKLAVNYGGLTAPATIRTAQVNVVAADTSYRRLIDIDAAPLQNGDGHPNDAGNVYIANAIKTAYIVDHP